MDDIKWEDKLELDKCFKQLIDEYDDASARKIIETLHPYTRPGHILRVRRKKTAICLTD